MTKKCPICFQDQSIDQYYKKPEAGDGLSYMCKTCRKQRGVMLLRKKKYGVSETDYQNLLSHQNYKCAICNRNKSDFKNALNLDHNHKTGKVRGLLCVRCNTLLGILESDEFRQFKPLGEMYLKKFIS